MGTKERPLLKSSMSDVLSSYVLRLCIVGLVVMELSG